jgi:hypothetical protein
MTTPRPSFLVSCLHFRSTGARPVTHVDRSKDRRTIQ